MNIFNFFLPSYCCICKKQLDDKEKIICNECFYNIKLITLPYCQRCGKKTDGETVCNDCIKEPHKFTRARALGKYEPPLSNIILLIKSARPRIFLAKRLGNLLGKVLMTDEIMNNADMLIPVPRHPVIKRGRGFNQSEILSYEISKYTGIQTQKDILVQIRYTKPQKTIESKDERILNVKNAFKVKKLSAIKDKRIILVDDVLTTGATADECAEELINWGAKEVYVLVAARAG